MPDGDTPAPVRFLPKWDSSLLAYAPPERTRILPEKFRSTVIRKNGDVLPTVLVDGFAADISDPGLLGSFLAQPLAAELKRSTAGGPFEDLSAAERERLASVMAVKEVEAGHLVFGRGETGSTLYIVDDGVIRLSVLGPDGNEVVLGRVEPGDFFGELALLDRGPRSRLA